MGDVAAVLAAAPSLTAAAKQLGVDRSTIHRWIEAGKVPRPERSRPKAEELAPKPGQSPDEWLAWVTDTYKLEGTDLVLAELACKALKMTTDKNPGVALAAMGRYQQLVRQLALEGDAAGSKPQPQQPTRPAAAPRRRAFADPRSILMAVK